MKKVERNAKGIGPWIWASAYGKDRDYDLPKNFCNYFWSSAWAYLIFIPAWPGHLINLIAKRTCEVKANWAATHVFFALFSYQLAHPKGKNLSWEMYWIGSLIILGVITGIVIIVFICAGINILVNKIKQKARDKRRKKEREQALLNPTIGEYPPYEEPKENSIVTWFKAFKGKYCPQIEWKNKSK